MKIRIVGGQPIDSFYTGWTLRVDGPNSWQIVNVEAYDGVTKIATVSTSATPFAGIVRAAREYPPPEPGEATWLEIQCVDPRSWSVRIAPGPHTRVAFRRGVAGQRALLGSLVLDDADVEALSVVLRELVGGVVSATVRATLAQVHVIGGVDPTALAESMHDVMSMRAWHGIINLLGLDIESVSP